MDLRISTSPLIGREQDVHDVCSLLQAPTVRLLTLSGPGGVGKTRLAIQVARDMAAHTSLFADGCVFVSLAAVREQELVLPALIQALGLKESGQQTPLTVLTLALCEKHALLVFDNFEHVGASAPLIGELLARCPSLKMLITSREVLHLHEEYEFQVTPLALPDLKSLSEKDMVAQTSAMTLFLQRVQMVQPHFCLTQENARTIAQICIRLDGLPLALELAAARMKVLSAQALLARLNRPLTLLTRGKQDVPERHQTLRRTIAWSHQLLSVREQLLFGRVAAFEGGASFQAIEAMWTTLEGQKDPSLLDLLTSLVEKSLLHVRPVEEGEEPRFLMLETIRSYALEQLEQSEEQKDVRQAHARYYLAFAEGYAPKLISPEQGWVIKRLRAEQENLYAALNWLLTTHSAEMALRMCRALLYFWFQYRMHEGYRQVAQALREAEGRDVETDIHAWGYYVAAALVRYFGDGAQSKRYCEESLTLFRTCQDQQGIVAALNGLGHLALERGDTATLQIITEQSLSLARDGGGIWRLAESLCLCAFSAYLSGDVNRARTLGEESLQLNKMIGEAHTLVRSLYALALFAHAQGDEQTVQHMREETLAFVHAQLAIGLDAPIAGGLVGLGGIVALQSHALWAVQLWGAGKALFHGMNISMTVQDIESDLFLLLQTQLGVNQDVLMVRSHLDDHVFQTAWNAGQRLPLEQVLIPPATSAIPPEQREGKVAAPHESLTPREIEVLRLLAQGFTSAQMAHQLSITVLTVNSHIRSIYSKLGIASRSAATRYAFEQKLL